MIDDEKEILRLTQFYDGVPVEYPNNGNPFSVNKEQNIFLTGVNTPNQLSSRSTNSLLTRTSLIDRVNSIIPRVSSFTTRATELRNSKNSGLSYTSREKMPAKRRLTMNEFVQQKREICKTNIAIDTQNKKVERLNTLQKTRELQVAADSYRIEDDTFSIKQAATEYEAKLARIVKEAETFSRSTVETNVKIKQNELDLGILKTNNQKTAEQIEQSLLHKEALLQMSPPGTEDPFDYFTDPKQILDRLSVFELEAVSLARQYDELLSRFSNEQENMKLKEKQKILESVTKIIEETTEINNDYKEVEITERIPKTEIDDELEILTKQVLDLNEFIFGQQGSVNSPIDQPKAIYDFYIELSRRADEAGPETKRAVIKRISAKKKEDEKQKMLAGLMKPRERVHPDVRKKGFVIKGNNRKLNKRELPSHRVIETKVDDSSIEKDRAYYDRLLFTQQLE
ncbi:hypothetical protein TVAG_059730 [Trichomonas vaginalis G3]|uniref:DUF4200 domain-containing protein n=1 Tax=Trichomonas vaginalis (strain ATCC PRA-98 / G3) TaxID=412133 RepID=A2FB25_TRIV3|nr:cilia- and flagella-associated protein 100 family [Trichomonas vaginalis G3]EAX97908.1 hypothetical protein TVAG_059730 [Trichomonas vaginalis G3]KAI5509859.1 cilia- and flagella-associated protein 100 family [Trichomonas vaginalis G3]|eukprot:XP_001310838.1 hypothetical protein [Trichomonas vaginalis G3]